MDIDNHDNSEHFHLETEHTESTRRAESNQLFIEQLEKKCDRLFVISETLWSILVKQLGVSPESIMNEIQLTENAIALRKLEKSNCINCGQLNPASKVKCMYCGQKLEMEKKNSPFI